VKPRLDAPGPAVPLLPGANAQVALQRCQRTGDAQDRLHDDEGDHQQMKRPEPEVPRPLPSPRDAEPDQQQPHDHKADEAGVDDEHEVGGEAI
jgi:hypothetical protein